MIDQVIEHVANAIFIAFLASWRTLPVFIVVAAFAHLVRKKVPARYLCWLWVIVIARLLLPWSIESTFAISSVVDRPAQAFLSGDDEVVDSGGFDTFRYEDEDGETLTVALLPANATAEEQAKADAYVAKIKAEEKIASSSTPTMNHNESGEQFIVRLEPLLFILCYLLVVALPAIAVAMLLRGTVSHLRFAWRLRCMPVITDRGTVDCLLRVCDDLRVGRRPQIKEVSSLKTPAVFGLFRPVICLPAGWRERLNSEQLDWVFRHEVAHVKCRDGLLLFVANIAKSVNWFNPLAWLAVAKLRYHMERAADELTIKFLNEANVREYGKLLLEFAENPMNNRPNPTVGLLAMAAPGCLQQRIESLANHRPGKKWFSRLVVIPMMACIAFCGLTDAKPVELREEESLQIPDFEVAIADANWPPSNSLHPALGNQEEHTIEINVEHAILKTRELCPGIDAEEFVKTYFAPFPASTESLERISIVDGMMTLTATKNQETLIRQMLCAFEQSGPWQIVTELRIMETNVRLLSQFDWSETDDTIQCRRLEQKPVFQDAENWEATFSVDGLAPSPRETSPFEASKATSLPCRAIKITRLQSERLIHQIQYDERSNLMQAPKVTSFNGQCGLITNATQRPFVTDVFAKSNDSVTSLEPKISVFDDGWQFLFKNNVNDEENVDLQLIFTRSSVEGVKIANLPSVSVANTSEEITIQVPTVRSDSIAVSSALSENEALLVFSPKPYDSKNSKEVTPKNQGMAEVFLIRSRPIPDHVIFQDSVTPTSEPK